MSSFSRAQLQRFAAQGAAQRAALWQVTITVGAGTVQYDLAKGPTQSTRAADDHGAGYIQRVLSTFLVPPTIGFTPALGTEFTIVACDLNAGEVGTRWRIFELQPGVTGEETRCVCFRLD